MLTAAFEDEVVRFRAAGERRVPGDADRAGAAGASRPTAPEGPGRTDPAARSRRRARLALPTRRPWPSRSARRTLRGPRPAQHDRLLRERRLRPSAGLLPYHGRRLDVSPRGSYVTQTPDVILRRDGSQVSLPQHLRDARLRLVAGRAVARRRRALRGHVVDVASLERYDADRRGPRSGDAAAGRAVSPGARRARPGRSVRTRLPGRSRPAGSRRRASRSGSASRSRRAAPRKPGSRSGCRP